MKNVYEKNKQTLNALHFPENIPFSDPGSVFILNPSANQILDERSGWRMICAGCGDGAVVLG